MKRKGILIILDGLGDRPVKELGGKTPLEYANTPNMDKLAKMGILGQQDPIAPGKPAGSDTAHLAIFGYDPYQTYRGRGFFEALGVGLDLDEDDLAFRVNFATIENGIITDRRAGRISTEEAHELARAIQENVKIPVEFVFVGATGHRAVLVLKGMAKGYKVGENDPHEAGKPPHRFEYADEESKKVAEILEEFVQKAHGVLEKHPINEKRRKEGKPVANYLLIRGAGTYPNIPMKFTEEWKVKAAAVVATALVKGVARAIGFDVYTPEGATGEYNTDPMAKAKKVVELLNDYDFVFLHFKPTDAAGHDNNPTKKVEMIEKADEMIGYIIENIDLENTVIAITGDHSTPCEVKNHSGDPVPLLIAGGGVRADYAESFGERECMRGGIGRVRGKYIVPMMMDLMGRTEKFGA
ncbi:2,3-bisphosphoglycerate-independent phosphoglycerate mutase [Thermococcus sp. 101 C5]|uniref:2,3-bisphosphoglycerate-independent phosphoglycerate mutase n=1 Tax=Thermococcus TaxID=2263 RepID=UPI00128C7E32|nr:MULTISPECIES: 2,3-bisphosphoglycerate-independent phosphoglycerate mutase [Thermococcus]MCA6214026.1 2,3-bisphosphoglycerate-independent phosphoglycerate mutase [Thermococcus bergensis]MDK2783976.1 2,3-bisphosphoglycerate-independent phosphoglycerate mutase [Thermococcaceae archaeon]MPW38345.1 2,3-bisphosphoglycerate-independent phosphoglycerate mutase [Thermococcus sp. 101 C5]